MMFALAAVLTLCGVCPLALAVPPVWTQPEQIHIAYPGHPSSMVVTWVTQNKTASVVEYGVMGGKRFEFTAKGEATVFQDGGSEKRTMFMHTVILKGLKPAVSYVYHCGSDSGWSDLFYFSAMQEGVHWSPRFALFGDMGNENPQSLARLQKDTQVNMYDAILHIGDFAYDMNEDNARIGDEFMRQVESIAAYVPYMTCPGNHENAYNFSNYRYRFSMPGNTESLWYSWNIGPVHVISFSTEVYFYTEYGMDLLFRQYQWLQKDLEEASRPENRAQRPWIITMGHRPMYCSNRDGDDCTLFNSKVRTGFKDNSTVAPGLEDLFYSHGVDLMVWAHEHSYERLWPMYNYTIYNGSRHEPYTNPKAPVHIITGSAGCRERTDPFDPHYRPWSAYRSSDYGYARMQVFNSSHLYLEQVSDDQYGKTIDSMWLIKDKHGPEAWL